MQLRTFKSFSWCLSVPNLKTVPPNRLNWTVILVAMDASTTATNSWAEKIHKGLFLKSNTEIKPWSQSFFNRLSASSLSSSTVMLYFGVIRGSSDKILRNFSFFSWLSWSSKRVIFVTSKEGFPHSSRSFCGSIRASETENERAFCDCFKTSPDDWNKTFEKARWSLLAVVALAESMVEIEIIRALTTNATPDTRRSDKVKRILNSEN